MELEGLGWDHTSPIRAESAKPLLCVWLWRWKVLTCQHLYNRTVPLRIIITLSNMVIAVCGFISIQPITNGQFGRLVVQSFLGGRAVLEAEILLFVQTSVGKDKYAYWTVGFLTLMSNVYVLCYRKTLYQLCGELCWVKPWSWNKDDTFSYNAYEPLEHLYETSEAFVADRMDGTMGEIWYELCLF